MPDTVSSTLAGLLSSPKRIRNTGKVRRACVSLCLFLFVMLFHIFILKFIEDEVLRRNCFSYELAYENFRNHDVSEETLLAFRSVCGDDMEQFCELLTMYFAMDNNADTSLLCEYIDYAKQYQKQDFTQLKEYVYAVWNDLECFPVGTVSNMPEAAVAFENSWMQSRTFGGERGHEGTDIMASVNERGIYPVYSMTDGVVENIGWLRLGGYRIGIRSDSGAYFYYAHLSEYAKDFEVGEEVSAGTFLGFMGDTGYSDIPGTTGNFAVHLHMGIYLNDREGTEFSVNSYPMLVYLYHKNE